MSCVF